MSTEIGISRKQTAFVKKETTVGTLIWPLAGDQVLPAGDAVINQSPDFVDSEEKIDSLDILDQFLGCDVALAVKGRGNGGKHPTQRNCRFAHRFIVSCIGCCESTEGCSRQSETRPLSETGFLLVSLILLASFIPISTPAAGTLAAVLLHQR